MPPFYIILIPLSLKAHSLANPQAIERRRSKFLDDEAKEDPEDGRSASDDEISEDDQDASDLSCIVSDNDDAVDAMVSPGMRALYVESMGSQGEVLGFGTPMHQKRKKEKGDGWGSIFTSIVEKHEVKQRRKIAEANALRGEDGKKQRRLKVEAAHGDEDGKKKSQKKLDIAPVLLHNKYPIHAVLGGRAYGGFGVAPQPLPLQTEDSAVGFNGVAVHDVRFATMPLTSQCPPSVVVDVVPPQCKMPSCCAKASERGISAASAVSDLCQRPDVLVTGVFRPGFPSGRLKLAKRKDSTSSKPVGLTVAQQCDVKSEADALQTRVVEEGGNQPAVCIGLVSHAVGSSPPSVSDAEVSLQRGNEARAGFKREEVGYMCRLASAEADCRAKDAKIARLESELASRNALELLLSQVRTEGAMLVCDK